MKNTFVKVALGVLSASVSSMSVAGIHCSESVTSAILHSNGNVYFYSERTCAGNWCQIDWGTDEKNKKGLAMLLLAKATTKPIVFYWPNLNSCSESNAVYASPSYMMFN